MSHELLSLANDLPYGQMLTETILLLHEPPRARHGLARVLRGEQKIPRRFALGALWHVTPRNIDVLSESDILQIVHRMTGLMFPLPVGAVFETRLDCRPAYAVPDWERDRHGIAHEAVAWQREHIAAGLPHHPDPRPMQLRECTVTVGLRIPLMTQLDYSLREWCTLVQFWHEETLATLFQKKMQQALREELDRFETHATALTAQMRILELLPVRLAGQRIVERLAASLNPFEETPCLFHPAEPLRHQAALTEPLTSLKEGFQAGTASQAHVFSLIHPPAQTYPGMLCAPRTPLDTRHALNLPSLTGSWPLSIVVQSTMADQQRLKATFESKQKHAKTQSVGSAGQGRADIEEQEGSLHELIGQMSKGIERVYPTGVHLIVWGSQAPFRALDQEIISAGIGFGLQWYREVHIGNTMFFLTLPLGCDPTYPHESRIRRHLSLPSSHVAKLMPLWGSFRGTRGREPQAIYINKRGEDILYNLFDGYKTPHADVVGASRSGKSFFVNDLLHQNLPLGATALILDRYGSYKDLCTVHGGTHLALSVGNQICLGPFDGPLDAMHRATLTLVLSEMCAGGKAQYALSQEENVILGQLVQAWVERGDITSETPMTAFARFVETLPLSGVERFCKRLLLLLSPYYGSGEYAGFVDGHNQLQLTDGLWSIDISSLKDTPSLMAVLIAMLFDRFERYVSAPENYAKIKIVILDEVAFLLESPESAPFVERHSRTLARMRCSLVVVTQNPSDFDSPIGKVIVNNSGSHVFFRLGRDQAVDLVAQRNLPPHFVDLITNLKQYEDCSEGLLYIEEAESGIIRVTPNRQLRVRIGQTYEHRMERERLQHKQEIPYVSS